MKCVHSCPCCDGRRYRCQEFRPAHPPRWLEIVLIAAFVGAVCWLVFAHAKPVVKPTEHATEQEMKL